MHYVREYSQSEVNIVKSIITKYNNSKVLDPPLQKDDVYIDNLVKNLPIGTIICIDMSKNTNQKKATICFPMFSSHFSLPIKKGEVVWFYKDNESAFEQKIQLRNPLLSVNSFWVSRKIGAKISEDLNFSHILRDSKIQNASLKKEDITNSKARKTVDDKRKEAKIKAEELKKIKLPDYKVSDDYKDKYSFLSSKEFDTLYKDSKDSKDLFPAAVPRWFSKPYELTLQGSNNSLINLTKTHYSEKEEFINKGAVDIVAGRHSIEEYNKVDEEKDFYVVKEKFVDNISDKEKRKINELKINKNLSYLKIKNTEEDHEILKDQVYYFGEEFKKDNNEGTLNLKDDASRIYLTEFDNLDSNSFYDTPALLNLSLVDFSKSGNSFDVGKKYLKLEKNISIGVNFSRQTLKLSKDVLPSIFIKSNDIRIVARKEVSNKNKKLKEGAIRIIKESNDDYNSSHIMLESDGKILIDGNSIMIGNFEKEVQRHNKQNSSSANNMHGNGFGVLLGYNEEISEPLVLGNTLEAILKEIIHINIALAEELKKVSSDLTKHQHVGVAYQTTPIPATVKDANSYSSTNSKKIKTSYEDIQKNLKDILSRFSKTS